MATGDHSLSGQANPDRTPSPPPDTPTVGVEEDSPGQFRGEGGCLGDAAASAGWWPEPGGEPRLSAGSDRRTGLPAAGLALKPCLALGDPVGFQVP